MMSFFNIVIKHIKKKKLLKEKKKEKNKKRANSNHLGLIVSLL